MGITQKEADALEWEVINAMPKSGDYTKESARKLLKVWNHLFSLMERENIFTDRLAIRREQIISMNYRIESEAAM